MMPNNARLSRPSDRLLARVALVSIAAAALSLTYSALHARRLVAETETRSGGYKVGQAFGYPAMISASADSTLVVWVDPRCGACQASVGFYKTLATMGTAVSMAIAAPEPRKSFEDFLNTNEITIAQRYTFSGEETLRKLGNVPSLTLVGRDGVVQRRWHGRLSESQMREVVSMLKK